MLVSHRQHATESAGIRLDRAIAPSVLVRGVSLRGVVQDERLTKHLLGVDSERPRRSLVVVLEGDVPALVENRSVPLRPGRALFAPESTPTAVRSSGEVLEIEWDPGALGEPPSLAADDLTLGPAALTAFTALGKALRGGVVEEVRLALEDALAAMRATGVDVDPAAAAAVATEPDAREQHVMTCIDRALSDLSGAPMLVDLESSLRCSGRTVSRHVHDVHARHALLGRGAGRWRGVRDATRLVVASILLSAPDATPASVSAHVGYGSVVALDHAFRAAGLPAPGALRRALRAA